MEIRIIKEPMLFPDIDQLPCIYQDLCFDCDDYDEDYDNCDNCSFYKWREPTWQ